ncbi:hypothetical protein BOTBODRAFT_125070 [Botryobasidium botryosum FD-172 SS1]|uniref:Uncharacterized protein n=1 Tax=Botryobasidium botryosum (strain FD-172 SS1) TaxID=930990 RepID=A0A067NBF2_BOTB1|nr:hypothetical protein BOTBODRAFT_125070 [Botryobasidium botryosum FD-172 SS1]
MRRVKVYELVGSRWTDRGTALCTGVYDEELDQAAIVAKSEITDTELLRSEIRSSDVYQRQQGEGSNRDEYTLIVWTEPDGTDYALSFQDMEGCAEIWDFIVEVQRHFRGKNADDPSSSPERAQLGSMQYDDSLTRFSVQSIMAAGRLPEPALGSVHEIDKAVKVIARNNPGRERTCEHIISVGYIRKLVDVLEQAEDLESLADLHSLFGLMHTILGMNDHSIYDHIVQDETLFLGVVGILEYDPEFPEFKASYRDFITNISKFKQVVPFREESVRRKIHQTYRLQYLKDVVLARILDDPTFNVLNSFIIFNHIDIINHIQHDDLFLGELFGMYAENEEGEEKGKKKEQKAPDSPLIGPQPAVAPTEAHSDTRKSDALFLIHNLCLMGKNVQIPARLSLYRTLVDRGLLRALEWALTREDELTLVNAAAEVLIAVVDHDVGGVRAYVLKQVDREMERTREPRSGFLLAVMKMMGGTKERRFRAPIADSLRTLLELPVMDTEGGQKGIMGKIKPKEDPVAEKFLVFFYDSCIKTLYKPIIELPEYRNVTEPTLSLHRERSSLFLYLCDLLCTLYIQHSHRSSYFILNTNITTRIASLFRARDKHLRLAALRFFRMALRANNTFMFRHIVKHDLLKPVVDLLESESRRDNLLSSSCQEFFDHIRKENFKSVLEYIMTQHGVRIQELVKVPMLAPRLRLFINRWEQNCQPPPDPTSDRQSANASGTRRWGQGQLLDDEEESYFNASDEDEPTPIWIRGQTSAAAGSGSAKSKRPRAEGSAAGHRPGPIVVPSPPLKLGLVDYDDIDDELGLVIPSAASEAGPSRFGAGAASPTSPSQPKSSVSASPERRFARTPSVHRLRNAAGAKANDAGAGTGVSASASAAVGPNSPELSPGVSVGSPSGSPLSEGGPPSLRMSEKRRRNDDDDDEMLGLLSKGKRPALDSEKGDAENSPTKPSSTTAAAAPLSAKEDGGKKIKFTLKSGARIAAAAATAATTAPTPSETNTKDADQG